MQLELDSRYNAVVSFITEASAADVPGSVQGHLYRFGTVLVCGYIERAVEFVIITRLTSRAQHRVLNFVKSHFTRGRNLDCNAVAQLLNRFDSDWYRKFERYVEADGATKEGVSSCYALRNTVAHGGAASVTLKRLKELLEAAKKMVDYLVEATR